MAVYAAAAIGIVLSVAAIAFLRKSYNRKQNINKCMVLL